MYSTLRGFLIHQACAPIITLNPANQEKQKRKWNKTVKGCFYPVVLKEASQNLLAVPKKKKEKCRSTVLPYVCIEVLRRVQ